MLINAEKFRENVEFLEEAILFIIDHYLEHFAIRTNDINEGLEEGNYDRVARAAHSMKNDISQFFAQDVYDNSIEIENAVLNGDLDKVKKLMIEYQSLHHQLQKEILEYKSEYEKIY